ncbi:hypothetical protein FH972_000024 [Carpinus fangiana]|uniref:Uncharacterized protein n=1 Tax=Carpinus fangiana TaxID=176857 RepID=A0A5N6Q9B9_9ROSI|nr:hypothetical protein FH972_000024 [Carpinus fangiana]
MDSQHLWQAHHSNPTHLKLARRGRFTLVFKKCHSRDELYFHIVVSVSKEGNTGKEKEFKKCNLRIWQAHHSIATAFSGRLGAPIGAATAADSTETFSAGFSYKSRAEETKHQDTKHQDGKEESSVKVKIGPLSYNGGTLDLAVVDPLQFFRVAPASSFPHLGFCIVACNFYDLACRFTFFSRNSEMLSSSPTTGSLTG